MEELDPLSPLFSPEKALYSDNVPLPVPNVRALDNISKCRWLLPPDDPNYKPQPKAKPPAPQTVASVDSAPVVAPTRQPAAPEAHHTSAAAGAAANPSSVMDRGKVAPAAVVVASQREHASVLTELLDAYDIGPLGALKRAIVERRQIKVWTRSAAGVKATLIGTLLLFDKHMNMVLKGVVEQSFGTAMTRRFEHLLLRGEHVILVALMEPTTVVGGKRKELT